MPLRSTDLLMPNWCQTIRLELLTEVISVIKKFDVMASTRLVHRRLVHRARQGQTRTPNDESSVAWAEKLPRPD